MADGRRELTLTEKPRAILGPVQPAAQDLQRQTPARLHLFGLIHLAHTATTEQPPDAVIAPGRSLGESRGGLVDLVGWVGRREGRDQRFADTAAAEGQQTDRAQPFRGVQLQWPATSDTGQGLTRNVVAHAVNRQKAAHRLLGSAVRIDLAGLTACVQSCAFCRTRSMGSTVRQMFRGILQV